MYENIVDRYRGGSLSRYSDKVIEASHNESNYVFSTYSIIQALELLAPLADFNTLPQDLPPGTPGVPNLRSGSTFFHNANDVYVPDHSSLKSPYAGKLQKCQRFFNKNTAMQEINGFVERVTEGNIKNIVDSNTDFGYMIFINAVYFKSKWRNRFEKTELGRFRSPREISEFRL